jgi:hypothetical protein
VSPELALIDPELAERARRLLPESDTLSRLELRAPPILLTPRRRPAIDASRIRRLAFLVVLGASVVLNVNLLSERHDAAAPVLDPTAAAPAVAPQTTTPAAPKAAHVDAATHTVRRLDKPRARSRAQRPRGAARSPKRSAAVATTLRWAKAPSAIEYDLVIWRGHERVLDVWTREPRLPLSSLSCADARKLEAGARYLWFAYPLLRRTGSNRFGPLLKWGVFRPGRTGTCG